ncbi:MAG: hypothetical protein CME71_05310 [Halobacteriovorax sp.]|nr:hypothetical protein [Halobacteriovorax sp.]|tara:strand:+ start:1090 stop:1497 length:408 start_codon:yes stop_codon:yes gene_type:complete
MKNITSLLAGFIFALGLGLSGMMNPLKVKMFLDVTRTWDPALAFVMIGAIAFYAITFRFIVKREAPLCEASFSLPTKTIVDKKLLLGSALFGVGWGLAGICPGPAFANLASGAMSIFVFVVVMVLSMFAVRKLEK